MNGSAMGTLIRPLGIVTCMALLLSSHVGAQTKRSEKPTEPPITAEEIRRRVESFGNDLKVSVWLGRESGSPWIEVNSKEVLPTASAIKTFYLVEFFAAHKDRLDQPLPGAEKILGDAKHPAISHFSPTVQEEIRRELGTATVRRIGETMMGKAKASNAVYNAAANLVTADLGGPEKLSQLIHARQPGFSEVAVRRYMLRDRKKPGDNEGTAESFASLYRLLANNTLVGIDGATMTAIRSAFISRKDPKNGTHYNKAGTLGNDPITEVRAGWWETPKGKMIYVVMLAQPKVSPKGRRADAQELGDFISKLTTDLIIAGRAKLGAKSTATRQ